MYKTQVFLEANGTETQAIYLKNNVFENVETVLKKGNDLKYPINIE